MNCVNHPEVPVTAYCQFCGKPLCKDCTRTVGDAVYCEQCLAARLGTSAAGGAYTGTGAVPSFDAMAAGVIPPPGSANPVLAALLGFIPGVGAMYNGQFPKALIHVLIFAIFTSLADRSGIFGLMIAGWVFYMVFDAYHTAKARRFGLPLPDPFGFNNAGHWFTGGRPAAAPPVAPVYPPGYAAGTVPPAANFTADPSTGSAGVYGAGVGDPAAGSFYTGTPYTQVPYEPVTPVTPLTPDPNFWKANRGAPTGAIILIGLGVLFLLSSMDIFHFHWLMHSWPLILIAVGIWLVYKRSRGIPPGGVQ